MYIINDICYAGEMQDNIMVTEAKPLRGGMMLVTRNLSSPILKTADDEVTFIWHIFITV